MYQSLPLRYHPQIEPLLLDTWSMAVLGWDYIILTGDFDWHSGATVR